jgi:hypothetical protein
MKLVALNSSRLERGQLLPVAQGFGDMKARHLISAIEIGESSCHPATKHWPGIIEFLEYDPSPEPKTMGKRLLAYWRRNGPSRKGLARQLCVDEATLWRWENNHRKPGCPQHLAMLRFLKAGCRPQIHYHQCPTG